jgi:hypothetical protein
MHIDLTKILGRKLPLSGNNLFKFEVVGDELVFIFRNRRTVKQKDGGESEIIDVEVLGGTKIDPKTSRSVPVKPGTYSFFVQKKLRDIFDREKPVDGDQYHLQLVAIRTDLRNMKEYGYEILEKVPRTKKPVDNQDDIAF